MSLKKNRNADRVRPGFHRGPEFHLADGRLDEGRARAVVPGPVERDPCRPAEHPGRGVKGLVDLVAVSAERKGHLLSPTDQIDTLMATGRFSFRIMASLAHLERELIVERTQAGLGAARRPCRIGGQKHLVTTSKVEVACRLLASGSTSKEIVKNLGISVPIRYRWVPMPLALLLYHNTNSLSMLAIDS